MSKIEIILAITALLQKRYGKEIIKKVAPNIAVILVLVIILSVMISALIITGLFGIYLLLTHYAMQPIWAGLISVGLGMVVIAGLISSILCIIKRTQHIPAEVIQDSLIPEVIKSFTEGFNTGK